MPTTSDEVRYRLRLARGFLDESREDMSLGRWRSCVDNSQLATENAAKAALAMLSPVGRTHNPAPLLRSALHRSSFPALVQAKVERLIECAELLGPDVHVQSDYGDEVAGQTPWDMFSRPDAEEALALAEEAVQLADVIATE